MRRTPRVLNRIVLALLGLLLCGIGVLIAAAGLSHRVATEWIENGEHAQATLLQQVDATELPVNGTSWVSLGLLGVVVIAIIAILVWLFAQGGGRTNRVIDFEHDDFPPGRTRVRTSLVESAVRSALEDSEQIQSARVSSWKLKDGDGLQLQLDVRPGVSVDEVHATASDLVRGLDILAESEGPVLIRISN